MPQYYRPSVQVKVGNPVLPTDSLTLNKIRSKYRVTNYPDYEVVESLGGMPESLNTMLESLSLNELRPVEYCTSHVEPVL